MTRFIPLFKEEVFLMSVLRLWFARLSALALCLAAVRSVDAQVLAPNLIYTSIQPCRIVDTRLAGGVLVGGTPRTFNVVGATPYGSQGGNGSGCGIPGFQGGKAQVQAVIINFIAVGPAGAGDLVAWPSDQAQPHSSIINYSSFNETVLNIANGIAMPVRQDVQGADITVLAQVSSTHLVADVVGYFVQVPSLLARVVSLQTRGVSAGVDGFFTCALRGNGTVSCWGRSSSGQVTVPGDVLTQVSAGVEHCCGVRNDGSVSCWGGNLGGQVSPIPAGSYTQVSAGSAHSCGVKNDGSAICWGSNSAGQVSPIPAGMYTQVAAARFHSCGVTTVASATCWGSNVFGQVSPIPGGTYTQVAVGGTHSCGLKNDGSVACWGSNLFGQVSPVPAGTYTAIAAGAIHNCGLKNDGSVACWGSNVTGQVSPIPAGSYAQVAAGEGHSCGVKNDGSVTCWGDNSAGQSAPPSPFP